MEVADILQQSVLYWEVAALIAALIFIRKYWHTNLKFFFLYLVIVVLVEVLALYVFPVRNAWIYNILSLSELILLSIVLISAYENKKIRKFGVILFSIAIGIIFYEFAFLSDSFNQYFNYGFGFSSICIGILGCLFIYDVSRTEKVLNISRLLTFWIVIGILFFHLCNLPITVLVHELPEIGQAKNLLIIQHIASIAMYICFIIGFIWTQKTHNT